MDNIYTTKGQECKLLSKYACGNLKFLKQAAFVYDVQIIPDFRAEFTKLFRGLGCFKNSNRIFHLYWILPLCAYMRKGENYILF